MNGSGFVIRFEGARADRHVMGMRDLGESLLGTERILTNGLYLMDRGRFPNTTARLSFSVQVSSPREGSYEILILLEHISFLKTLSRDNTLPYLVAFARDWLVGVLHRKVGRVGHSDETLMRALENADRADLRSHETTRLALTQMHDLAKTALETNSSRFQSYAKRQTKPIGSSCTSLVIPGLDEDTEFDVADADVIRSGNKLDVGERETLYVQADGFSYHRNQLRIRHPTEPGRFLNAHIQDPAFGDSPNVYTEAAVTRRPLKVIAKRGTKDGRLHALYILDAQLEDTP